MFQLPKNVKTIIEEFQKAGYEAYAVGGCVRDTLLSKEPQDWDITTSATPEEMKQIFNKTIDTGIQHGTVTVRMGGESYEVTTYRIDGEYEDGRHPKQVQFTSNLREDLRRRDFTINAMAYSESSGLVDMFEGVKDLEEKRIRAVGNPTERFSEDALRMLRAVRFAAQLGFSIEEETKKAIKVLAPNLRQVSKERIHTEFIKLLRSPHPEEVITCHETGLLEQFFPELSCAMDKSTKERLFEMLQTLRMVKQDKDLRLAILFDFCGKELLDCSENKQGNDNGNAVEEMNAICEYTPQLATKVLRELKLDGNTIRRTSHLLKYLRRASGKEAAEIRRYFSEAGEEHAQDIIYLKKILFGEQQVSGLEQQFNEIRTKGYCIAIKDLALTGVDLLALGVSQGKEVGVHLKAALEYVLQNPEKNTKENLTEFIRKNL